VLHVTPYSAEAWAYGGIPRVADALAKGLAARGHDVTVCATDVCDGSARLPTPAPRVRFAAWPPSRTAEGVTLHVFPNVSNRLAYHAQVFLPFGLNEYLRGTAGSFDVAHLHACRNMPGAIAAHHLRRARVPYVLAPNGTALRIERRRIAKRLFDLALGTRIVEEAARVLAVSEAERSQLRSIGVPATAIRLVPNPVGLDEFTPPPSSGRFRSRIGGHAGPLVVFLGKLTPRKRLDVLIRALATVRDDARLVIAGNDMGAGRQARQLVRTLGLGGRTVFVGLLRGPERLEALADADVVVYPSQDEIFGLVPLEALLCGTPVIVADDSGCAEIVGAVGGGQIVPLGDAARLASAIDDACGRAAYWRAAAAQAGAHIRASYARDIVCAQLDDVYREVMSAECQVPGDAE
jgi:glycosyltransferase involved in cell wall biosynthesis